jgi:hypothetical protein
MQTCRPVHLVEHSDQFENATLLDMARPMFADFGNEWLGLASLGERFAGYDVLHANDLHNATPALGAMVRQSPHEGSSS